MVQPDHTDSGGREITILAIDTSTEWAGLALATGERVLARSWNAGRTQTTSVLPAIDEMVREAGLTASDIGAVAVATGPGTFTGLRVGMSIAKGLVLARGIPIVGIPTLEIAAAAFPVGTDLVAVLPSGRGRVVWQRFGPEAGDGPRNTTLDELVEALAGLPETVVAGELGEEQQALVSAAHLAARWGHRDPATLVYLARERLAQGRVDDPVTLEPVYLHGVVVQAGPVQDRLKRKC
jgi:tRNA threonylcarbamoyladenosine biosynthesis protein TsaB